jgi:hypothetical protein
VENKKIRGATTVDLGEIHFKSKLERSCYLRLKEAGFEVYYEPQRITIWEGGRIGSNVLAYQPNKRNKKEVEAITRPLLPITYTPDFIVISDNLTCYFDAKGYSNDRYPMKKKMFLKHLNDLGKKSPHMRYMFFEIGSISQLLYAIQIIRNMSPLNKIKSLISELPDKDKALAEKFLQIRDFRSLWELVHSCLIRIKRNAEKEIPDPKYQTLDVDKLQTLEAEVSNYQSMIEPHWLDDREAEEEEVPTNEEY